MVEKSKKYFRHVIANPFVKKFCRLCPHFGGVIEELGFYDLVVIKCETLGAQEDENCEACCGTLAHLAQIDAPPEVIYEIVLAIERQTI